MNNKSLKELIVEMYEKGESIDDIANHFKLKKRIIQKFLTEQNYYTAEIPLNTRFRMEFSLKWVRMQRLFRGWV